MVLIMLAIFGVLLVLGAPILAAMGVGAAVGFAGSGLSFSELCRPIYAGISSFTLLSIM